MFFNTNFFKYFSLYVSSKDFNNKKLIKKYELSRDIPINSKVCIYGFGPYGRAVLCDMFFFSKIVGIFDMVYSKNLNKILSPDKVTNCNFDFIIITVMNENGRRGVVNFLTNNKVSTDKIVFVNYKE
ncbi:hypothetical protein [Succinivibrio dextrinosolvens]|uniref:hypothetical protein n=1 Tax=Succinivibrio dextrinosolvens TaxID=83771 RepID=UPI0019245973|nr:hypothetical protein [Succinivibrio dextrinosolvens]